MPQIILDQAEIIATVRQGIATTMPQHMGMHMKRQPRALAGAPYQIVDRKAGELIAAFRQKEPGHLGVAPLREVSLEPPELIGS